MGDAKFCKFCFLAGVVCLFLLLCGRVGASASLFLEIQENTSQTGSDDEDARVLRWTIPPGLPSTLYLTTLPNAVCSIHGPGSLDHEDDAREHTRSDDEQTGAKAQKLFATSEGRISFQVQPPADESDIHLKLVVVCEGTGVTDWHRIVLRASLTPTLEMPAPTTPDPSPKERNYKILPALTQDQLSSPSDVLLSEGYPYRPDPTGSPEAYAAWLEAVAKPVTMVEPEIVANQNIYNGSTFYQNYNNWSGYIAIPTQPFQPYVLVAGVWKVPSVTSELTSQTDSSFWIGMDGAGQFGGGDLFQGGTSQSALASIIAGPHFILGQPLVWTVSNSYAWSEIFPFQAEQVIKTFLVRPGDQVFCEVWVGWEGSNPTPVGGFQFVQIVNQTTSESVRVRTAIVNLSGFNTLVNFHGKTAEWIMERPSHGPNPQSLVLYDLANYQSQCTDASRSDYRAVTMGLAAAILEDQSAVAYGNDFGNINATMVNGNHILSIASPIDIGSICFEWANFH